MKKTVSILFLVVVVCIIGSFAFKTWKRESKPLLAENVAVKDEYADLLYGNWVGNFDVSEADSTAYETEDMVSNKINIIIKKIEKDKAYGQSVVAGNSRPLVGGFNEYNGEYRFTLDEPGDHKNDGQFIFTIVGDTLKGKWTAKNKKSLVWERDFKLTRQPFRYDSKLMLPEDGEYVDWYSGKEDSIEYENEDGTKVMSASYVYRSATDVINKLNASTTLLKESDVKNLKKLELEVIRNTIFARHGYTFKKRAFRQFFDHVDWYIPVTDDMSGKLTPIEQKNIVLLNRFQKYAEDNYDSFGR